MEKLLITNKIKDVPQPSIISNQQQDQTSYPKISDPKNQLEENSSEISDIDSLWKSIKEQLRLYISETHFKSWYTNVFLERIEAGVAEISCDTVYKKEWIDTNNRSILKRILLNTTGQNLDIAITLRNTNTSEISKSETPKKKKERVYEYYNPNGENEEPSIFHPVNPKNILNPRYTFTNFIIGSGNQLAYAVAEAVSTAPGTVYNPVFYYGGTGVGKTHLMLAIGNKILENIPNKKVVYCSIETFLNELIESIRSKKNEEFRKKYREVDCLIIDDIQFIGNYPKTQEEIFNTFNTLHMANKQIIMASDRLPREIPNITDRLKSRFEGGMVVDIQPPDFETRIAILQQKGEQSKIHIPMEIIEFIAENIHSNIRELEGAMTKVISIASYTRTMPTINEISSMLQVDIESKRQKYKPKKIISIVAQEFGIDSKDLLSSKRTAGIALARQVVMFILRDELKLPLEKVAEEVNRKDHTTVIHACEKVIDLYKNNINFRERVDKCKILIKG